MVKLLLTGIPGTGKSTIGNNLENKFGYKHIDLESQIIMSLLSNPAGFIKDLCDCQKDIVVTWGFIPNKEQTNIVKLFKEAGFKLIWFDGHREAAKRVFNDRGNVSEDLFNLQLQRIDNSNVIKTIEPIIYNVFKKDGTFKNIELVINDLVKEAKKKD